MDTYKAANDGGHTLAVKGRDVVGGGANNGQAAKDADARPKDDGDVAEGALGRRVGAVPEKVGDRGREAGEDGRGEDGVDVAVDVEMPPERALVVKRHRGGLPGFGMGGLVLLSRILELGISGEASRGRGGKCRVRESRDGPSPSPHRRGLCALPGDCSAPVNTREA